MSSSRPRLRRVAESRTIPEPGSYGLKLTTCSGGLPPRIEVRYWMRAPAAPTSGPLPPSPNPLRLETPKWRMSAFSPAEGSKVQRAAGLMAALILGRFSAAVRSGTTIPGGLAARQPERELPRDRLSVLLEGLEEGAYLVEEDRALGQLGFELGVAS